MLRAQPAATFNINRAEGSFPYGNHSSSGIVADGMIDGKSDSASAPAYFPELTMHYDQVNNINDRIFNGTQGKDILAYLTGTVDQELLARNEYPKFGLGLKLSAPESNLPAITPLRDLRRAFAIQLSSFSRCWAI